MMPLFRGEADRVHGDDYVTVMFHGGRAFVRQGHWKLVTLEGPFDEAKFALFDLSTDPGETTDLRSEHPERFQELLELWRRERQAVGISLPGDPR